MKTYEIEKFGLEHLSLRDIATPEPGPGEVRLSVRALSLNFRDLLVINGLYNPRLRLPAVPFSDGAGTISAIGPGVESCRIGDAVMTHFVAGWLSGPFEDAYLATTLGTPGPGLAAEEVVLPASAVLPIPSDWSFAAAATLPIAALTAWSALVTEGETKPGDTVLSLGTGGVSIFAAQIGKALGARVIVTSSSDAKIERVKQLGADEGINYATDPQWERRVLELTGGRGADVVVENGGAGTLSQSLRAVRAGGTVALLGALTGLSSKVNVGPLIMRRIHVAGVMVDSREVFENLVHFLSKNRVDPVIDRRFGFDELPAALAYMESAQHFGKIVVETR